MLVLGKWICIPNDKVLNEEIFCGAHESRLVIHLGNIKTYRNLKKNYSWPNMKREIAKYMAKYVVCQQVKVEHQQHVGQLQPLSILWWKWEYITMDFVSRLPRSKKGNDVIWVIMDQLTKYFYRRE